MFNLSFKGGGGGGGDDFKQTFSFMDSWLL